MSSSHSFTNFLKPRIYKFKCYYSHLQFIKYKETQFYVKNSKIVVSKFVKLCDEFINSHRNIPFIVFIKDEKHSE